MLYGRRLPGRRIEDRAQSSDEQIKALLNRLITVQEDERRRISRDLHDHLGQQLTALRMNLEVFRLQSDLDPARLTQLSRTQYLADELDRSIDFLIWQLRPAALEDLGLRDALRELTATWSERLGLEVRFQTTFTDSLRLQREVEDNLFRIAQEALHNVLKHAEPVRVTVSLVGDQDFVELIVEDEGRGFDYDHADAPDEMRSLGLTNMRERATMIGGEFTVASELGVGTSVVVRVPTAVARASE